ncbi:hypothetical protein [Arsenicicoccus dermatophilus]|uniref:hypothetical protein n=1 Tax=Arsenicicoccus dermatophilus TaxID=1076331 RepID=UPI001F4CF206|nr:hypothetical protein [Arsenicicoccus dermatophilus]MCH8611490.1 hypothetical protein [Arsenicicoccus dermatophilus]
MPRLDVRPELITIRLALLDRIVALRGDVRVRRDAIHAVEAVADAMRVAEDQVGRRRLDQARPLGPLGLPPVGIPGLLLAGDVGGETFAVTYRGMPGVVLQTRDPRFRRIVLSLVDPDRAVAQLAAS